MLKRLRIQLTLVYLAGAVLLALIVGAVSYTLVSYYFGTNTDYALKVKVGLQFAAFDIPLPLDLYEQVRSAGLVITLPETENGEASEEQSHEKNEGLQETELADIFVVPLTQDGEIIEGFTPNSSVYPIDRDSAIAAYTKGSDMRTVTRPNGVELRILSYKVPGNYPVQIFQAGRYLTGQQNVLTQLLQTMVWIGAGSIFLISFAAWLLAGRNIRPIQTTWNKQQEFVANASHELRAPLTLIRAGVELASRSPSSTGQKQLLNDVLSDTDHMNKLIEELLLLSRLDSNAVPLDIKTIEIVPFFQPILRQLQITASQAGIELEEHLQNFKILGDQQRLEQLVLILFDNATQHTPRKGTISVLTFQENDKGCIRIQDSGEGIPDEQIDRVFDRFYRVKQGNTKGSGLGLSIAKSLVEAQKGSIVIKNCVPKGLEVTVRFPLASEPD